jgi:hydrogenase expression/formation protein HypE
MTPDPPEGLDGLACPIPIRRYPHVLLAHGGGGRLMHELIERIFMEAFRNPILEERHDGARLDRPAGRLAFTTDSYVVRPLFFPGGDIGSLAVFGTVNDLAMCGARPLYLSAGFIIEEGLPVETLWKIAVSMRRAARSAGVTIVTGDTKVVDRGHADGVFINTAGIGSIADGVRVAPDRVATGDRILLSGDVGRHGIAVMAVREGLEFESPIESDCAPLAAPVLALLEAGIDLRCLRDLTRGGLASALVEISEASGKRMRVDEAAVPVLEPVRGACEILGFDPLYVANEGRFVAFVPAEQADRAVEVLRSLAVSQGTVVIGEVEETSTPLVALTSRIGATRVLDMLSGEQLPRIC